MVLTAAELLEYISNDLQADASELDEASPLFSSGIIDSFSLVSLICFIEARCGFEVNPADVTLDNMDSIERLLAFVERMSGRPAVSMNGNGH